jgi:hypothetical protein
MIQVIKYKCCGQIFAACQEPECYTDKDWLKELRKYALRGDKVEMMESANMKFGRCECSKVAKKSPDLFTEQNQ